MKKEKKGRKMFQGIITGTTGTDIDIVLYIITTVIVLVVYLFCTFSVPDVPGMLDDSGQIGTNWRRMGLIAIIRKCRLRHIRSGNSISD